MSTARIDSEQPSLPSSVGHGRGSINHLTLKTLESYARAKDQEAAVEFYLALIAQTMGQATALEEDKDGREEDPLSALFRTLMMVTSSVNSRELARFTDRGQWEFSSIRLSLAELKAMSDAQLDEKVILDYADLQEFANAWPDTEGILLNDHGRRHLLIVLNKLKVLIQMINRVSNQRVTPEEKREMKVGVIFHDSGMAIAGRKGHEQTAIELLRSGEVVEDWDPSDPFCARIEHLIIHHVTSNVEADLDIVRHDRGLALVIMADELHLERRTIPSLLQPRHVSYIEDPWIRIAQHIKSSTLQYEIREGQAYMIWDVHYDPRELERVQSEMIGLYRQEKARESDQVVNLPRLDILDALDTTIFCPKFALLEACAQALFGFGTKVGVRCNNTFYEVNEVGIVYP